MRILTPEQMHWFATNNADANGRPKPYEAAVKPFGFLAHALVKRLTMPSDADKATDV